MRWINNTILTNDDNKFVTDDGLETRQSFFFSRFCNRNIKSIHFTLLDDNTVSLSFFREKSILEPKSLESHLLNDDYVLSDPKNFLRDNWEGGPLPISRKTGQLDISLEGREKISVDVSTPNINRFCFSNNKDLINMLSENIMKILFEKTLE